MNVRATIRCWRRATRSSRSAGADHRRQGPGRRLQLQPDQSRAAVSSRSMPSADVTLELIGRKGRDFFRKRGAQRSRRAHGPCREPADLRRRRRHRAQSDGAVIANDEIDAVYLLYNEFKSVMAQKVSSDRRDCLPSPEAAGKRGAEAAGGLHLRAAAGRDAGARCCRGTWRWRSTARCWNRPPPNTPRA